MEPYVKGDYVVRASALNSLILVVLLCLPSAGLADILILNSYHRSFSWTDNIVKSIGVELEGKTDQHIDIEYMDTKEHVYDEEFKQFLKKSYEYKFRNRNFDLVITTDDNALNFVKEFHELFDNAPVIFAGVNNLKAMDDIGGKPFTGIFEIPPSPQILALAFGLHPNTDHVVMVYDETPTGKYHWDHISQAIKKYPDIRFERIQGDEYLYDVEKTLSQLGDNSLVIFATYYRDKSERYIPLSEAVERLTFSSNRPIYTAHRQIMKYGTVGGKVLSGDRTGQIAGRMALEYLSGTPINEIAIYDGDSAEFRFNYDQLVRFNINLEQLPAGSIIAGKPISIIEHYWQWMLFILGLIIALVIIIVLLGTNLKIKKQTNEQLEHFANTDNLTAIRNKFCLENWLAKEDTANKEFFLILIDIDHFKFITNHYGINAGNTILLEVSNHLLTLAGDLGTLYRIERDSFALVWYGDAAGVKHTTIEQNILDLHQRAMHANNLEILITYSLGAVSSKSISPTSLLNRAEMALYRAKQEGGNTCVNYSSELSEDSHIIGKAKEIIKQNQSFELHFQPIVDLGTERIVGYESLLRVDNQNGGYIPPPIALMAYEYSGLLRQLTISCFDKVFKLKEQLDDDVFVNINLSRSQLLSSQLMADIQKVHQNYDVSFEKIVIEVVENQYIEDKKVINVLNMLHQQGFEIAIDDFGTGYSSISSLRNLPVDFAKLDKSFLRNDELRNCIATTNDLCVSLHLKVICEGIETREDARLCHDSGCMFGQGYYFGRPMPATTLLAKIEESSLNNPVRVGKIA